MNKLDLFKRQLSVNTISFLIDIGKGINIDKSNKYRYFQIKGLNLEQITNFIFNIKDQDVFLIDPFISKNCRHSDPYLSLSRQFLITKDSNPKLIWDYLFYQLDAAGNSFEFNHEELNYYLIFKYKPVLMEERLY
jgi:hypothetical protein